MALPTQAFQAGSSTNGYLPGASQYLVEFVRDPKRFPVDKYTQIVEAPDPTFYYWEIERDQMIRQHALNLSLFADGAERPIGTDNQLKSRMVQATCLRYDFNVRLGDIFLKTNQWKAKELHLKMLASQAMLGRAYNAVNLLETVANWGANTSDANTLNGGHGNWITASDDPSDSNYNAIRLSLMQAYNNIFLATNGQVSWRDLRLVVSPNLALGMSNSPELHNYIRQTERANDKIEGDEDDYADRFGLPRRLYGLEVVIENTPYLTDLSTAGLTTGSTNRQFLKKDTTAFIVSRPGGLDGTIGASFSTVQTYYYGSQLKALQWHDEKSLFVDCHVEDYYTTIMPAPYSGWLVTATS